MIIQDNITVNTTGRGFYEITSLLHTKINDHTINNGLCHVFVQHTSASLIICENADPDVQHDVEQFFARLVVDGDRRYRHLSEGEDDMSAHIRSLLTQTSLTLPISKNQLNLGIWQGVYLYEHRYRPHKRSLIVSVYL